MVRHEAPRPAFRRSFRVVFGWENSVFPLKKRGNQKGGRFCKGLDDGLDDDDEFNDEL